MKSTSEEPLWVRSSHADFDPQTFKDALEKFSLAVGKKAIRRAKEKDRPMNPWDRYDPKFIRARLVEEIGEWLMRYTTFDNENNSGVLENDELFDITALACSVWMVNQKIIDAKVPKGEGSQ